MRRNGGTRINRGSHSEYVRHMLDKRPAVSLDQSIKPTMSRELGNQILWKQSSSPPSGQWLMRQSVDMLIPFELKQLKYIKGSNIKAQAAMSHKEPARARSG